MSISKQDVERPKPDNIDYAIASLSPILIIGMIGSLVYFLVTVFYQGEYTERLLWILGLYTFASVLISRIAIEHSRAYSYTYMLALGAATLLVTPRFFVVEGALAIFSFPILVLLLILIAYLSDRITFDCTIVDDRAATSGEGLLQSLGLVRSDRSAIQSTSNTKSNSTPGDTAKARKHNPGVWVLYFALLALPLFGIGQLVIRDPASKRFAFLCLFAYLVCSFSLLVLISLLSLRRYLRERNVTMELDFVVRWIAVGFISVLLVVGTLSLLPLPSQSSGWLSSPITFTSRKDLEANRWGWGNEPAARRDQPQDPQAPNPNQKPLNKEEKNQKPPDGAGGSEPGQKQDGQSKNDPSGDSKGGNGKSNSDKSGANSSGKQQSQQSKDGKPQSSKDSQKTNEPPENRPKADQNQQQQNGQQQKEQQQNEKQQDGKQQKDQQDRQQQGDGVKKQNDANKRGAPDKPNAANPENPAAAQPKPAPSSISIQWNIGALVQWIVMLALLFVAVVYGWRNRQQIMQSLREFLAMISNWFAGAAKESGLAAEAEPTAEAIADPYPPFRTFDDPFGSNGSRMTPEQIVRHLYRAILSWGYENRIMRRDEETPDEYLRRLSKRFSGQRDALVHLGSLYSRVAYSRGTIRPEEIKPLSELWQWLNISYQRQSLPKALA